MPDFRRQVCREDKGGCGRSSDEVGPISWSGFCGDCGPRIFERHNDELHEHRGDAFLAWRRAMAATVGGVLLDDVLASEQTAGHGSR